MAQYQKKNNVAQYVPYLVGTYPFAASERAPQLWQPPPAHRLSSCNSVAPPGSSQPAYLIQNGHATGGGSHGHGLAIRDIDPHLSTYRLTEYVMLRTAIASACRALALSGAQRYRHCGSVPWEKWRQTDRQRHRGRAGSRLLRALLAAAVVIVAGAVSGSSSACSSPQRMQCTSARAKNSRPNASALTPVFPLPTPISAAAAARCLLLGAEPSASLRAQTVPVPSVWLGCPVTIH